MSTGGHDSLTTPGSFKPDGHRAVWLLAACILALAALAAILSLTRGPDSGPGAPAPPSSEALAGPPSLDGPPGAAAAGPDDALSAVPVVPAPELVSVVITSEPSEAAVHLDNRYAGVTPLPVQLAPGQHVVLRLRVPGFEDWVSTLDVTAELEGTELDRIVLAPSPARVTLTSTPPGATVIDAASGEVLDTTPCVLALTRSDQPRTFDLRLEGFRDQTTTIVPNQGQVARELTLERRRTSTNRNQGAGQDGQPESPPVEPENNSPFRRVND